VTKISQSKNLGSLQI